MGQKPMPGMMGVPAQPAGASEKEKELEREVEKLKKQLQESEERQKAQKTAAEEANRELKQQMQQQMQQQLQQMQAKSMEMEKLLSEAQSKLADAQQHQSAEAQNRIKTLTADCEAKDRELQQAKTVSKQFAQMVSVLLKENAAIRLNSEKMIAEAKSTPSQKDAEQLAALQARVTELEGQLAAAQNEKMKLSQEMNNMRSQLGSVQEQGVALNGKQKELEQAQQTVKSQEARIEQAQQTIKEQEARIEQLTAKNAELASTATKAADALTSVSVKFKQCTQLCADEKDRANQAVAMVATLKTQLDEQKRRGDSLEQANTAIKDKVDKLLAILRAQGWHPGMMNAPQGGAPGAPAPMAVPPQQPAPQMQPPQNPQFNAMQQQMPPQQQNPQSMVDLSALAGEVFPAPQTKGPTPAYGQFQ